MRDVFETFKRQDRKFDHNFLHGNAISDPTPSQRILEKFSCSEFLKRLTRCLRVESEKMIESRGVVKTANCHEELGSYLMATDGVIEASTQRTGTHSNKSSDFLGAMNG